MRLRTVDSSITIDARPADMTSDNVGRWCVLGRHRRHGQHPDALPAQRHLHKARRSVAGRPSAPSAGRWRSGRCLRCMFPQGPRGRENADMLISRACWRWRRVCVGNWQAAMAIRFSSAASRTGRLHAFDLWAGTSRTVERISVTTTAAPRSSRSSTRHLPTRHRSAVEMPFQVPRRQQAGFGDHGVAAASGRSRRRRAVSGPGVADGQRPASDRVRRQPGHGKVNGPVGGCPLLRHVRPYGAGFMANEALMIGVSGMRASAAQLDGPMQWRSPSGSGEARTLASRRRWSSVATPGRPARWRQTLAAAGCEVIDLGVVTTPGVAMMVTRLGRRGHGRDGLAQSDHLERAEAPQCRQASRRPRSRRRGHCILKVAGRGRRVRPRATRRTRTTSRRCSTERAGHQHQGVRSHPRQRQRRSAASPGQQRSASWLPARPHERQARTASSPSQARRGANLQSLCDEVRRKRRRSDLPRSRTHALAIVNENGTYIGEEYTLALCVQAVPRARSSPSSSRMIDRTLTARFGGTVVRTPVGEAERHPGDAARGCCLGR